MIKLGTWRGIGSHDPYKVRKAIAWRYANAAYNDAVKHAGWPGYIVIRNSSGNWDKDLNIYYYVNEPTTSWLAKYKITDRGLVSL